MIVKIIKDKPKNAPREYECGFGCKWKVWLVDDFQLELLSHLDMKEMNNHNRLWHGLENVVTFYPDK